MKSSPIDPCLQPVFLVCSERSGSNLIRAMMDAHADVFAPPPMHLGRDIGCRLYALQGLEDPAAGWMVVAAEATKRVERFFDDQQSAAVARSLADADVRDFGSLLRSVYGPLMRSAGKTRLFLKENHIHRQLFFLLQNFPDARFVFQVRDPRDYLASVLARKKGWLGNKYGSNRHALDIWREDQLGGLCLLAHLGPGRVFVQRYEDLIRDPARVLGALCDSLGLVFDHAMLEFHKSESVSRIARDGGPWENLKKPLMTSNSQTFKAKLTGFQVRMVETYVGDLMDVLGYAREHETTEKPAFLPSFLPQLTEPFERLANGDRAPFYSEGELGYLAAFDDRRSPIQVGYRELDASCPKAAAQ